jgi:hypothetical protein
MYEPALGGMLTPYDARVESLSQGLGTNSDIGYVASRLHGELKRDIDEFISKFYSEEASSPFVPKKALEGVILAGSTNLLSRIAFNRGKMLNPTEKMVLEYLGNGFLAEEYIRLVEEDIVSHMEVCSREFFSKLIYTLREIESLETELTGKTKDYVLANALRYGPTIYATSIESKIEDSSIKCECCQ